MQMLSDDNVGLWTEIQSKSGGMFLVKFPLKVSVTRNGQHKHNYNHDLNNMFVSVCMRQTNILTITFINLQISLFWSLIPKV